MGRRWVVARAPTEEGAGPRKPNQPPLGFRKSADGNLGREHCVIGFSNALPQRPPTQTKNRRRLKLPDSGNFSNKAHNCSSVSCGASTLRQLVPGLKSATVDLRAKRGRASRTIDEMCNPSLALKGPHQAASSPVCVKKQGVRASSKIAHRRHRLGRRRRHRPGSMKGRRDCRTFRLTTSRARASKPCPNTAISVDRNGPAGMKHRIQHAISCGLARRSNRFLGRSAIRPFGAPINRRPVPRKR
jgi:hypothetical protein